MNNIQEKKIAIKVSSITIILNILLSIFKLFAGIISMSGAMISDAVHSASDVFSTVVVIIGINISRKGEDDKHQYGHEKLECIAAMLLAGVLIVTAIGIGYEGIVHLIDGESSSNSFGYVALIAAVVSIISKEWMYWYTLSAANKINSSSLRADAWHHRSDSLSSVGSLVGIGGAMLGFWYLDPIASIIICILVLKAGYDIANTAISQMVDEAADEDTTRDIENVILMNEEVLALDLLKTRIHGSKLYVDVEIALDSNLTLIQSHSIAEKVHDSIEDKFSNVKHCMVHVNPYIEPIEE